MEEENVVGRQTVTLVFDNLRHNFNREDIEFFKKVMKRAEGFHLFTYFKGQFSSHSLGVPEEGIANMIGYEMSLLTQAGKAGVLDSFAHFNSKSVQEANMISQNNEQDINYIT